jgi:hypothetical protein
MMLRALPFNLVVTNVPGPQLPLYMLGSQMLDNFGLIPLIDYLSLGIVLFSYNGQLCWGFTCDWDLLPELHDFVTDIAATFDELRHAAGTLMPAEEAPKTRMQMPKTRRRPHVVRGGRGRSHA